VAAAEMIGTMISSEIEEVRLCGLRGHGEKVFFRDSHFGATCDEDLQIVLGERTSESFPCG
jgi:hypothetical protein